MSQTADHLLNETLALPEPERLKIAEALLASLPANGQAATNRNGSVPTGVGASLAPKVEEKVNRTMEITLTNWQPESGFPPPPNPPKYQYPPDVWEFAVRYRVAGYLDPLMEALRRQFPNAESYPVYLEDDLQYAAMWRVVFEACIRGWERDNIRAARSRYHRETFQICPAPLNIIFRLNLDYVE
jgi:hypothetical protein